MTAQPSLSHGLATNRIVAFALHHHSHVRKPEFCAGPTLCGYVFDGLIAAIHCAWVARDTHYFCAA
jgi:hypothetical protein